jgi:hypothetical protein
MQNQGAFQQIFGSGDKQPSNGSEPPKGKLDTIVLFLVLFALLFYPFVLASTPLIIYGQRVARKDKEAHQGEIDYESWYQRAFPKLVMGAFIFMLINILFALVIMPRAYLSCYLLFPLNLFHSVLRFNLGSVFALFLGGIGQGFLLLSVTAFVRKRKVTSMSEEMEAIKSSKQYKERQRNKFDVVEKDRQAYWHEYQLAKLDEDPEKVRKYEGELYIGTDEFGKRSVMNFVELNQHLLNSGTTGSGKTTLNMIFVDYAIRNHIPILYIDGKGAKDTLQSVERVASKYKRTVKVFSDTANVRYNPIKHGNSVMVRDRLVTLAETESVFYSGASKSLLQSTVQFLDTFEIPRTLQNMSDFFLPRNVLMIFLEREIEEKSDLLFVPFDQTVEGQKQLKEKQKEQEKQKKKEDKARQAEQKKIDKEIEKKKKQLEKNAPEGEQISLDELDQVAEKLNDSLAERMQSLGFLEEDEILNDEEAEEMSLVEIKPEQLDLEKLYALVRRFKHLLRPEEAEIFKRLFQRYEHKDNPFYLYATSEALQTNTNMLIDSELGHLFNTEEPGIEELDLLKDSVNSEIMFITLNGLVYKDYIKTLAQFFVSEINYLASENYVYNEFQPFLLICDEPSVYINDTFLDTVNKGRGAGLHTVFSPQMLADIDRIDPILTKQIVGNCNTYFIGQNNSKDEIDTWSSLIGTYGDVEKTEMIEQEQGFSDVEKTDWVASRGTKRNVRNFVVHPDDLRDLRQGEFVVYRKSGSIREQARRVYVANPAKRTTKS